MSYYLGIVLYNDVVRTRRVKEVCVRMKELEDWLTPAEAGRIMGMSKQSAVYRLENGTLRGVKTHQGWLVDPKDAQRVRDEKKGDK